MNFKKLWKIDLSFCNLNTEKAKTLGVTIQNFSNLRALDFSFNPLDGEGLKHLCAGLKSSSVSLQSLNFCGCGIDENNSYFIDELLKKFFSLTILNLTMNPLKKEGFLNVCRGLKSTAKTLQELYLSSCQINFRESEQFGNFLNSSCVLKVLNLSFNEVSSKGDNKFTSGLKNLKASLENLNLSGCHLDKNFGEELADSLNEFTGLRSINLSLNPRMENSRLKFYLTLYINLRYLIFWICMDAISVRILMNLR